MQFLCYSALLERSVKTNIHLRCTWRTLNIFSQQRLKTSPLETVWYFEAFLLFSERIKGPPTLQWIASVTFCAVKTIYLQTRIIHCGWKLTFHLFNPLLFLCTYLFFFSFFFPLQIGRNHWKLEQNVITY